MKAKYFLTIDFMNADKGRNMSLIWHSLLEGKSILAIGPCGESDIGGK